MLRQASSARAANGIFEFRAEATFVTGPYVTASEELWAMPFQNASACLRVTK
jgi:hypothetical protein